jgi:RNA polymerase sigma-70 factor (ECF subfamily)
MGPSKKLASLPEISTAKSTLASDAGRAERIIDANFQPSSEDGFLLERIYQRDEQALVLLFDRHSRLVYSVALRVLRDPASAEDVLQDVFMHIWRKRPLLRMSKCGLGSWLSVVSRNRSVGILRGRHSMVSIIDFDMPSFRSLKEADGEGVYTRAKLVHKSLSVEQRETFEMAFFEGLGQTEISDMTGCSPELVKTRIRLALASLRKDLQAERAGRSGPLPRYRF